MAKIIDSVRLPYAVAVISGTTGRITSDRVKPGQSLVCQSIAWKNETAARGTASLQIRQGNVLMHLGDQLSPAADTWYYYAVEQHVNEGEQVEVEQASCGASDKMRLEIIGYIEFKKDLVKA